MAIARVWIEDGCIVCNACESVCPDVFNVTQDTCHIRSGVRIDGQQNTNLDVKSLLVDNIGTDLADQIEEAADHCPVDVIKFEKTEGFV